MIHQTDRFAAAAPYRQALIQEGCPVYVHCSRVCTDRRTADRFLQLRMVNCGDREIDHLILCVDGYDAWGAPCGKIAGLILPDCKAKGHSIFGEDRLIAIGKLRASRFEVTVEQVSFADGLLWRCRAANHPQPLEDTDWTLCRCGLPNPPEQTSCSLCGRFLGVSLQEDTDRLPIIPPQLPPEPVVESAAVETFPAPKPEPILRSEEDLRESYTAFVLSAQDYDPEEEGEEEGVPRWLFILLCVVGGLALMIALGFLFYFLRNSQLI